MQKLMHEQFVQELRTHLVFLQGNQENNLLLELDMAAFRDNQSILVIAKDSGKPTLLFATLVFLAVLFDNPFGFPHGERGSWRVFLGNLRCLDCVAPRA